MSADTPVYLVDNTSGNVSKLLGYLQRVTEELGHPPEVGSIFPRGFDFSFSRIHVSVQLSEERLREDEARQQERRAGHWTEPQSADFRRYARRTQEEHNEQAKRPVVQDWETARGDIRQPQLQRAIILGDPGFGKSWLLRYEGYTLAQKERKRLEEGIVGTADVIVPVFVRLGRLAQEKGSLLQRIKRVLDGADGAKLRGNSSKEEWKQVWQLITSKKLLKNPQTGGIFQGSESYGTRFSPQFSYGS